MTQALKLPGLTSRLLSTVHFFGALVSPLQNGDYIVSLMKRDNPREVLGTASEHGVGAEL